MLSNNSSLNWNDSFPAAKVLGRNIYQLHVFSNQFAQIFEPVDLSRLRHGQHEWLDELALDTDDESGGMSLHFTWSPFPLLGESIKPITPPMSFPSRGRNSAGNEYLLQFTSWPKNYVGGCGCQPVYQCLDIPLRKAGCHRQAIGGGFCGEKSQSRIPQRPGNAPSNADTLRYSQTMLASLIVSRLGSATIRSRVSRSTVT